MTGSKPEMNAARLVDSCMIAMGLSERVTGKADCVGKFDVKALNGRMAQRGPGLHLVVRSGFLPANIFGSESYWRRYHAALQFLLGTCPSDQAWVIYNG